MILLQSFIFSCLYFLASSPNKHFTKMFTGILADRLFFVGCQIWPNDCWWYAICAWSAELRLLLAETLPDAMCPVLVVLVVQITVVPLVCTCFAIWLVIIESQIFSLQVLPININITSIYFMIGAGVSHKVPFLKEWILFERRHSGSRSSR